VFVCDYETIELIRCVCVCLCVFVCVCVCECIDEPLARHAGLE
jgi:hypothetical protein